MGTTDPPSAPTVKATMKRVRWMLAASAGILTAFSAAPGLGAQQAPGAPTQGGEPAFQLRSERNLVVVRVVVRDPNDGAAVANLTKEDFQLFDNGKPQEISQFSVEHPGQPVSVVAKEKVGPPGTAEPPSVAAPQRFLALYFDDLSTPFGDLAQSRDAARRYIKASMQPGDRAGIYTSSGRGILDFTDDRDKLEAALAGLRIQGHASGTCGTNVSIPPYMAYVMAERNDNAARDIIVRELFASGAVISAAAAGLRSNGSQEKALAQTMAESCAREILGQQEIQSRLVLQHLTDLVRRMSASPGERDIVLISSGFFSETLRYELNEVIDRALRAHLTISALDARGVAVFMPGGDASQSSPLLPQTAGETFQYLSLDFETAADSLAVIATGTGGVFFHNNNDLDRGFRETGALPGFTYVLAFSPQELNADGSFHTIKVRLTRKGSFTFQARRGYFAPRNAVDDKQQIEDDLRDAIYSRDEVQEIPITTRTQFFKSDGPLAKLAVMTHVGLHSVRFQKEAGLNVDDVTVLTALFDDSGNFVDSQRKIAHLRLLDSSVAAFRVSGFAVRTEFDVHPGVYMIREVVRDSQGQISTANNSIEIP